MQRRGRTKSRTGCRECKRRHRKCDETRPSCVNCRTSNQRCSFLTLAARTPAISAAVGSAVAASSPTTRMSGLSNIVPTTTSSLGPSIEPNFTMRHMELLYHCRTGMLEGLDFELFLDTAVREAFKAPWLMDQILAVSAAHLNSRRAGSRRDHQVEAALLQARALAKFNVAKLHITIENYVSMSVFSVLVALHVMYEALSARTELPDFLGRVADWFTLSRGVVLVSNQVGETELVASRTPRVSQITGASHHESICYFHKDEEEAVHGRFEDLVALIQASALDECSKEDLAQAVRSLQGLYHAYGSSRASMSDRVLILIKWPLFLRPGFSCQMRRRCPEALVVLAHFGMLLHSTSYFWPAGDSGRFLIESITDYLGSSWEEWLAWPNKMLRSSGPLVAT